MSESPSSSGASSPSESEWLSSMSESEWPSLYLKCARCRDSLPYLCFTTKHVRGCDACIQECATCTHKYFKKSYLTLKENEDGEPYIVGACHDPLCKKVLCSSCTYECVVCEEGFCDEGAKPCERCAEVVCDGCARETCVVCRDPVFHCYYECRVCEMPVCSKCERACEACQEPLECGDCERDYECPMCGFKVCYVCAYRCRECKIVLSCVRCTTDTVSVDLPCHVCERVKTKKRKK